MNPSTHPPAGVWIIDLFVDCVSASATIGSFIQVGIPAVRRAEPNPRHRHGVSTFGLRVIGGIDLRSPDSPDQIHDLVGVC